MRQEPACDVPPSFVLRQPALPARSRCPCQKPPQGKLPESSKLAGQPLSGMMPAYEPAVWIAGDEHDTRNLRSRQPLADDRRCPAGEPAQTAFLPGGYDRSQPVVVGQGRAGLSEGESPTRTLATASNRPGRRCAAALAERRLDAAKCRGAAVADLRTGKKAEQASLRQEEVEHVTTLGRRL